MKSWANYNMSKMKYIMGGECFICGYNKSNRALHIHHLDPSIKTLQFSHIFRIAAPDILKIKQELQNGCLLCSNCHCEVHDGITTHLLESTFSEERWQESLIICEICGEKSDSPFHNPCRCLSKGGAKTYTTPKVDWSKIDVVLLLHRNDGNLSKAGHEVGLTDQAVRKSFRKHTGYNNFKEYEEDKSIISFSDEEVVLNFCL